MRGLWKPIAWIIALQAVCLALGLWIHGQFVAYSAESAQHDEAASQLTPSLKRLSQPLTVLSAGHKTDQSFSTEAGDLLTRLTENSNVVAVVASSDMRVIASGDRDVASGTPLSIRQLPSHSMEAGTAVVALQRNGNETTAIITGLPNGRFILVYEPGTPVAAGQESLQAIQLPVSAISFLWIGGMQAAVMFLFLSRVRTRYQHAAGRTTAVAEQRQRDLVRTRDAVIFGLAKLAESRDPETGHHLERIASFAVALCNELRANSRFRDTITPEFIRNIAISSALHDIGKVGIEDAILLKPGALTEEEREQMQQHTLIGGDCLQSIERRLAGSNFLEMAREIALYHHEHWNGEGYSRGISGEQIPLPARIVAVADVYDALSVRRVYKEAFPHEKCVEIIREASGRQFDPEIVNAFLRIENQFQRIAEKFRDRQPAGVDAKRFEAACERDNRLTRSEADILESVVETADETTIESGSTA